MNPDLYGQTARALADDENVDMLMVIAGPESPPMIQSVARAAKEITKPMAVAIFDLPDLVWPQAKFLLENNIPVFRDPKRAGYALAKMVEYAEYRAKI